MVYALQVIVYTAAMLLIYTLFLRNRVHHQLSRYYLLLSAIMPMLIPLIELPQQAQLQIQQAGLINYTLPSISISAMQGRATQQSQGMPLWEVFYIFVALVFLAFNLSGMIKLWSVIRRNDKYPRGGYTLVLNSGIGPGSFGRYIFFPGAEADPQILAHEEAHTRKRHSYDIVFVSLLQAVCWPNVFLYLVKRELKEVHEFQADQAVDADKDTYAALILSATFHTNTVAIMHSFINHPIKRRIMMLRKNGTGSPLKATFQVAVSVAVLFSAALVVQSCQRESNSQEAPVNKTPIGIATSSDENAAATAAASGKDSKVQAKKDFEAANLAVRKQVSQNDDTKHEILQTSADKMPVFIGDNGDLSKFISRELRYPAAAKEKKITGKVIVKFIVSSEGKVQKPEIMRSPDPELSEAALAVVAKMPDWKPAEMNDGKKVAVEFYLPISFQL